MWPVLPQQLLARLRERPGRGWRDINVIFYQREFSRFSFLHPLPEPSPASGRGSVVHSFLPQNLFMQQRLSSPSMTNQRLSTASLKGSRNFFPHNKAIMPIDPIRQSSHHLKSKLLIKWLGLKIHRIKLHITTAFFLRKSLHREHCSSTNTTTTKFFMNPGPV
jgi:hypothetical protein